MHAQQVLTKKLFQKRKICHSSRPAAVFNLVKGKTSRQTLASLFSNGEIPSLFNNRFLMLESFDCDG